MSVRDTRKQRGTNLPPITMKQTKSFGMTKVSKMSCMKLSEHVVFFLCVERNVVYGQVVGLDNDIRLMCLQLSQNLINKRPSGSCSLMSHTELYWLYCSRHTEVQNMSQPTDCTNITNEFSKLKSTKYVSSFVPFHAIYCYILGLSTWNGLRGLKWYVSFLRVMPLGEKQWFKQALTSLCDCRCPAKGKANTLWEASLKQERRQNLFSFQVAQCLQIY